MKRCLFGMMVASVCMQAATTFQLTPSGVVSGTPGSTVGWGFTLTNTSNYFVVTGASFTPTSLYGTFQDYISTGPLIVVGPSPESTSVSEIFNAAAHTGVGAFRINSTAPSTLHINGNIVLDYSVFSQDPNDPNFNPDTSTVVADATITAPAAVNVTPEPASLLLLGVGMLGVFGVGRRAQ